MRILTLILCLQCLVLNAYAEDKPSTSCVEDFLLIAENTDSIQSLRETCFLDKDVSKQKYSSDIEKRIAFEQSLDHNPYSLTPHRPNYFLPINFSSDINPDPFESTYSDNFSDTEFHFQFSIKTLMFKSLFKDRAKLWFGYTNRSFWQIYSEKISKPFRETNHEPELLLTFKNDYELFGFKNRANIISLNHQSNGRENELSRSWNRVMFQSIWYKNNLVFSFRPWYRIPEKAKTSPEDTKGDDNPDIEDFMGKFDLQASYKFKKNLMHVLVRNNLKSDNKGAIELGWSFPFRPKVKGYVRYFNGYGDSLIDYNFKSQSLGLGVELTGWY